MEHSRITVLLGVILVSAVALAGELVPLADPGFEKALADGPNRFGHVFEAWTGWIYAKPGYMEVSELAHSGTFSGLVVCDAGGKVRFFSKEATREPGRYRLTFHIRALDVVPGRWNENVSICSLDGKWHQTGKGFAGTYGWRKVTHVVDVLKQRKGRVFLGLCSAGRVWFDDVAIERVGEDVPLTVTPQLGPVEEDIVMPGELDAGKAVRCPTCAYRNMPAWAACYACGSHLEAKTVKLLPPKLIASFEAGKPAPFDRGEIGKAHATEGTQALKWNEGWIAYDGAQDWNGYDFLKADFFHTGGSPITLNVEIRDRETKGYWTRVNHTATLLPGTNTVTVPTNILVGEKSRPGRNLLVDGITRLVYSIGKANTDVYIDNVRLECDDSDRDRFPELHTFDFGLPNSPLLKGMTRITAGTTYTRGRGYGLLNAQVWRSFDVLQPDVVYRDFVCIEKGGLAVDLPDGVYHVFVNIDCPGGFWGELPKYRSRKVMAEGKVVSEDTMDRAAAVNTYFRFADQDDLYTDNTFDKYLGAIFEEKAFDVHVTDGQLNVEFDGPDWSNCVSCLVAFPVEKMAEGSKYLATLKARRRADFDNYFRKLLHVDKSPSPATGEGKGYCIFARDYMEDIYPNTKPRPEEIADTVSGFAAAGELEPVTFAVWAHRTLGSVKVTPTDLVGPGTIPASEIRVGYVSNRISRQRMDGTLYTIKPRLLMNTSEVELRAQTSRRFWATVKVPEAASAGVYKGALKLQFANGDRTAVGVEFEVVCPALDPLDVPAGPWGLAIRVPWFEAEMADYNAEMDRKCLALMREYGLTAFSSPLGIRMKGKGRDLALDFSQADRTMAQARDAGMHLVVCYGVAVYGLNVYGYPTPTDPKRYGFGQLGELFKHVFGLVDQHAREAEWLPIVITACDEPVDANLAKSAANAALLKACSSERVRFAGATSMRQGREPDKNPHLPLVRELDIANYNSHDVWSIGKARESGSWAFYNGGNRWTYGFYMFMLRQKYGMAFRLSWHWNCNAGDPYYALDCREDDYAWVNANRKGELVRAIHVERLREGVDDYRHLLTLKRLVERTPDHADAPTARKILGDVLSLVPHEDRGSAAIWATDTQGAYLRKTRYEIAGLINRLGGK
ncbi:MAG: hypothetical protein HN742_11880 [Lentisphaerae bacterium]|jgi:hypothetical protein|nr:hypothetical protein [Lentisphaerota bacterium]MBT4817441.1 hypothetical protein [Lentisphaerota bacterium]MBT5606262.1 hypothetical protein [Lentisphaerota bacterium]MBT7056273.1 hypothetical protein [Lentisphaerota bacterium]MBT7842568.1 hypothetical protein [Lentisphaerota bacterium]